MSKKVLNYIFLFLTVSASLLIFFFSSQNGEESGVTSSRVVRIVLSLLVRGFDDMGEERRLLLIGKYGHIIRKAAHFSEFAFLGFSVYGYLSTREKSREEGRRFMFSLLFSFLYAVSDECHQLFSDGRTPSFLDVLIDTSGALFGILILFLISRVIKTPPSQ